MDITKQIAKSVRALDDEKLCEMALRCGFSVKLVNGETKAKPKARARAKPEVHEVDSGDSAPDDPRWAVLAYLQNNDYGHSTTEIAEGLELDRKVVAKAIAALKDEGKVFQGGERRFARYAVSQKLADDASLAARSG